MIYLDNSATTKPHDAVLKTFIQVNEHYYANPASIHASGVESNTLLTRAREQVAAILATDAQNIIFTAGGTEANNFAIFGIAEVSEHKGKHILTTEIEHPSVLQAVNKLAQQGYEVEYLTVDANGVISLIELAEKVRKDTVLVSIMHVNNEMGAIQPIKEAAQIIHAQSRAMFHVDAVQSFGKLPLRFDSDRGPDFISISGHKIHALKGSGVLAMRKNFSIAPQIVGGGQEFGLRSGTVAVPQAVAFAKAARLAVEEMAGKYELYKKWSHQIRTFLQTFGEDIHVLSTEQGAPYILSFSVRALKGEILINALQSRGIIVSTSSACSSKQTKMSHVVEALKIDQAFNKGVLRISFGAHTTEQDIKEFTSGMTVVMKELKGELIV